MVAVAPDCAMPLPLDMGKGPTWIPPVRAILAVARRGHISPADTEALRSAGVLVIECAYLPMAETRLMNITAPPTPFPSLLRPLSDNEIREMVSSLAP